ncbi:MAG: hypothetical protein A2W27_07795 [Deltaproteobacteria bacterium RBG_16_44_11]|nr:MAG: hypothetical protein A2W27_07795 [Deltaproteobacteria bacterium RBG_16_44_11]
MIGVPELIVLVVLGLLAIPSLLAFIDIMRSNFEGGEKIFWIFMVIFFSFIGAIVYFIIGRKQKIAK